MKVTGFWRENYVNVIEHYYLKGLTDIMYWQTKVIGAPKYKVIKVLSKFSFFQYCDSNVGHFSITPIVIALNPSFLPFSYSLLKAIAISLSLTLCCHLWEQERKTTIAIAIIERLHRKQYSKEVA